MVQPLPAPSLRELSSEARLRECRPMVAPCQRFTHRRILALKFLSGYVHRSTLPQLRCAQQLPQRGSRGTFPFNRVLANIRGYGRFSSPLRNSKTVSFYHSSGDTPSVTPVGRDSSLREGAGKRSHSTGCSLNRKGTGDFHRPYETLNVSPPKKIFRFLTQKRYRAGHLPYRNQPKA